MSGKPTVVLLHGMARSRRSMGRLQRYIEQAGYPTWARSYPSRRLPLEGLAETVSGWIEDDLGRSDVVGVTHSMGGILARHMSELLPWRGLVMIAPPNRGSRVAAMMRKRSLFRWFYGQAGQQLSDPRSWPPPPAPYAVIAGTRGLALGNPTSWMTRGLRVFPPDVASDGTVAVDETRLDGMADFATVDASHTWILNHPHTLELVLQFLDTGRLAADSETSDQPQK